MAQRSYVIRIGLHFVRDDSRTTFVRSEARRFTHAEANLWCLNHPDLQTAIEAR